VTVIPNAVDIDMRSTRRHARRDAEGRAGAGGRHVVGFIGSFYAYEGLDLLLQACRLLHTRPQVRVLLVGGGPQEAR
jgi:glycogen(starch) synthase